MPIYGKPPLKIFFSRTILLMELVCSIEDIGHTKGLNDEPGLILTYLTSSIFASSCKTFRFFFQTVEGTILISHVKPND